MPRPPTYDATIAGWFAFADQGERFPETLPIVLKRGPSCATARTRTSRRRFYARPARQRAASARREQVQGKELSYNNYNDADAALELVAEFRDGEPTVVIVKHANPCGVATARDLAEAYEAAFACDTVSAFGGIIAVNRPLDGPTARGDRGDLHRSGRRARRRRRGARGVRARRRICACC